MTATAAPMLITGATGRHGGTGAHIVSRLRQAGRPVRVLVREMDGRVAPLRAFGAEVVVGDLHDRASLVAAFKGVEAASFTYPVRSGVVDAAANFAAAARDAGGCQRIVVMSMGASHPESPSPLGRAQWLAEEILTWAGLNPLVLRIAAFFYENVPLLHSRSVREEGVIRNSFADAAVPWISGEDAAELAASALLHPERFEGGAVHYPPGAELLSHADIATVLCEELGRPVRFEAVTHDTWRAELEALAGTDPTGTINPDMARHISTLGAGAAFRGRKTLRPPDAAELHRLTGRTPLAFRDFVRQVRERFVADA